MTSLRDKLDGDVPDDVPHWIVEYHWEGDERYLTPLQAVQKARKEINEGHSWLVTHIRSGLQWSVALDRQEVVEVSEVRLK
jgi:hypothetical protein